MISTTAITKLTMSNYQLTWITDRLAVGYAPMSYAELDSLKKQGIDAIVNLCGEFCDLHEIEEDSGFEVFFLPIPDESAPDMAEMEKALQWLDEAIYLGKKVLIHCRHGIGRTGTFVTGYLLRRGMGMKMAEKTLKGIRANPTNFRQWWMLRKYGKISGTLTIREPSLINRNIVDLGNFFTEYEELVNTVEESIAQTDPGPHCGVEISHGCHRYFEMHLIEAIYLSSRMNKVLTGQERREVIGRAVAIQQKERKMVPVSEASSKEFQLSHYMRYDMLCPLNVNGKCLLSDFRPISCRVHGQSKESYDMEHIESLLSGISRSVFMSLSGIFPGEKPFFASCVDTVSGRFAQIYFHYLISLSDKT